MCECSLKTINSKKYDSYKYSNSLVCLLLGLSFVCLLCIPLCAFITELV